MKTSKNDKCDPVCPQRAALPGACRRATGHLLIEATGRPHTTMSHHSSGFIELPSRDGTRTERVGNYILGDSLGTGSFGAVYLGVNRTSQERVAVKVLPKDTDAQAIMRISGEVSTMEKAGAGCPFIVQLYEVMVGANHIYLICEYAGGGELFKSIFLSKENDDANTPEREQRARGYFHQLVMGLHYCHRRGVVHRDVKPQNLLLSITGVLKIADFGLAASFNPDPSLRLSSQSMRHTMCGSPLYMAPEMLNLRNGGSYDALATDAWGCGAVLHAMLFGGPPFPASSFEQLVNQANRPHAHLRLPEGLNPELGTLIRSLLRLDPKQRCTLPQVAQSPWFQQDLAGTLSRTPYFRLPEDMKAHPPARGKKPYSIGPIHAHLHLIAEIGRAGARPIRTYALKKILPRRSRARVIATRLEPDRGRSVAPAAAPPVVATRVPTVPEEEPVASAEVSTLARRLRTLVANFASSSARPVAMGRPRRRR